MTVFLSILPYLLGGGGLLGIATFVATVVFARRSERTARLDAEFSLLAHRRDVCVELLEGLLQAGSAVTDFRGRHDTLLLRFTQFTPFREPGPVRGLREAQRRVAHARSELVLDENAAGVLRAAGEYVMALGTYVNALAGAMRLVLLKVSPNELAELSGMVDSKMAVLEAEARKYVAIVECRTAEPQHHRATLGQVVYKHLPFHTRTKTHQMSRATHRSSS